MNRQPVAHVGSASPARNQGNSLQETRNHPGQPRRRRQHRPALFDHGPRVCFRDRRAAQFGRGLDLLHPAFDQGRRSASPLRNAPRREVALASCKCRWPPRRLGQSPGRD